MERVGDDGVAVADLLGGETSGEIAGEWAAVLRVDVDFHLRRFDGGHAGDVFGEEGLLAHAERELTTEPFAEDGVIRKLIRLMVPSRPTAVSDRCQL